MFQQININKNLKSKNEYLFPHLLVDTYKDSAESLYVVIFGLKMPLTFSKFVNHTFDQIECASN